MPDFSEQPTWVSVPQLTEDDDVVATTEDSDSNVPHKNNTWRTRYLRDAIDQINLTPTTTPEEVRDAIGAAPGGSDPEDTTSYNTAIDLARGAIAQGRLTLTLGDSRPTADVTGATALFYTPDVGDKISLLNTSPDPDRWDVKTFNEISISLVGLPALTCYDVFLYDNAGTLTLNLEAWTDSTPGVSVRNEAISQISGVWVKTSNPTYRLLGTILTNETGGQCDDFPLFRGVANANNLITRPINFSWTDLELETPPSDPNRLLSWTVPQSTSYRRARDTDESKIWFACCLPFAISAQSLQTGFGANASYSMGFNTDTDSSSQVASDVFATSGNQPVLSYFNDQAIPGANFLIQTEMTASNSSQTWASTYVSNVPVISAGITGLLSGM